MKQDLFALMTDSQEWWPADYGHYGPFFIRMAWHSAGTYRIGDGRGGAGSGTQRFAPLNSWPDNANLDKARRLLWPIKQKYGRKISWADLLVLTGNCALESMGFKTFGFGGGRADVWEPEEDVYWGPEDTWLGDKRYTGDRQLANPLAAVQMGLIYVNPEGPNGNPDPLALGPRHPRDVRAHGDERRGDRGADRRRPHLRQDPWRRRPEPVCRPGAGRAPTSRSRASAGSNSYGSGNGEDTITSGLEGAWTTTPTKWGNNFFENLFGHEWELTKSPAGANQWTPKDGAAAGTVPDAHDPSKSHAPDDADDRPGAAVRPVLREDFAPLPREPRGIRRRLRPGLVQADPSRHGAPRPLSRPGGPGRGTAVAGPDPAGGPPAGRTRPDIRDLKAKILATGLSVSDLVSTAWASASTFRGSDKRGGANGARIRLEPQKDWEVNQPARLAHVLQTLEGVQTAFNAAQTGGKKVSLADVIVIGGAAGVEQAAKAAGHDVDVPVTPGRMDASQEKTDAASFAVLEPVADGFRNFQKADFNGTPEKSLVDRAQLLTLSAPEMTVLLGGLRVLNANAGQSKHGVLTDRPETLTNDFFVNLLAMGTTWKPVADGRGIYEGVDRASGAVKWTASRVDLLFGSNSQLRALSEVFASGDGQGAFVSDFVAAWTKVMNLDRFDIA